MEWEFLDRELCISTPKSLPNPPRKSSKTERHGVRRRSSKGLLFFCVGGSWTFDLGAGVVAPVAARQTCLRSVNVQCCYATLES